MYMSELLFKFTTYFQDFTLNVLEHIDFLTRRVSIIDFFPYYKVTMNKFFELFTIAYQV